MKYVRFDNGKPAHGFMKWKSYDGTSFEQVCRCGFHTADDLLFMDHVDKRLTEPPKQDDPHPDQPQRFRTS